MKSAGKREKKAMEARAKHRRRRLIYGLYAFAGIAIISLVVFLFLPRSLQPGPGQAIGNMGNQHIPFVESLHEPYNSNPPTSGPHVEALARWGIHNESIPKEIQVHNLEDGGVILHYQPGSPDELVAKLKGVVERYNSRVILAPYPGLDSAIALTAWTRLDKMDEFDEGRVTRFIGAYRGIDHHR